MMKFNYCFLILFLFSTTALGQPDLSYYLPGNTSYNPQIPTPKSIIGHEVGQWHITHDKLVYYMRAVAAASDRISLIETGKTHEDRPQLLLVITSPENHSRIEEIQSSHKQLTDPGNSASLDISAMPVVIWLGFSIHGNESSGSNAALLGAYYYAAAEGPEVNNLLQNAVILIDPCFNPDGLNRFASWANSNKSKNLIADANNREQNEFWPRGRTNHYFFDLNRDWLPVQQPESQNRIRQFHAWKPNILTDHHEMGTNSTFFFQPGIPSRTNPNTPAKNQELTERIGQFHAQALDEIQSLYYSKEDYDDFYYGKGSTFPDINGGIGILFEQASSRGHAQESIHGTLKFPFTVKNQFTTVLSTTKAGVALREELLSFQRDFYQQAMRDARGSNQKAIVFSGGADLGKSKALADILIQHEIEVFALRDDETINGINFDKATSFLVPLEQPQSVLIKSMFEKMTSFKDSLFYDVSSWTLPLAFNLDYTYLDARELSGVNRGTAYKDMSFPTKTVERSQFAYAFKWSHYFAPQLLNQLLQQNLRPKVATQSFSYDEETFPSGSIIVPLQSQDMNADALHRLLSNASKKTGVPIHAINSGNTSGVNLGSRTFQALTQPKIALLVEGGISSYDAGEIWHLLDQRFDIPVSLVPIRVFNRIDLGKYNTIVLANGSYSDVSINKIQGLKGWIKEGGTLIAFKNANRWLHTHQIVKTKLNGPKPDTVGRKDYRDLVKNLGAQRTGGSIFEGNLDITHPIGYGYSKRSLPVFVNSNNLFEKPKNPYAFPLQFSSSPLISGYVSEENLRRIAGKPAIVVSQSGKGRIISFSFNPNFRAFWYGTNKLFLNSIFFGKTLDARAAVKAD